MDKNILKQLKADYEDLNIEPSANLWNQIESGLNGEQETAGKPLFQWWKYAAVVVLLISIGGGLFYFNSDDNPKSKETVAVKKHFENNMNSTKVEATISSHNTVQDLATTETKITENNNKLNSASDISTKKDETFSTLTLANQETKTIELPVIKDEKLEVPVEKPLIAEKKKASYISADDLLLGRELDKTREENNKDQRKFGVFDISKIKGPSSLKIFGFSVISDSVDSK